MLRSALSLLLCAALLLTAGSAWAGEFGTIWQVSGAAAKDFLGSVVACAGDVNDDGYEDIIVGATGSDENADSCGSAIVYSGRDGKKIYTYYGQSASDHLGLGVGGVGDIDGDGYSDFIIGAPYTDDVADAAGTAWVYSGKTGKAIYTLNGGYKGQYFGHTVAGLGDVNADKVPDFAISSPGEGDGTVRVYSGKTGSRLYTVSSPEARAESFGETLAAAGDVNADGTPDFLVGDPEWDWGVGMVFVLSGKDGKAIYTFYGVDGADNDQLGRNVGAAGDVNADGYDDFICVARGAEKDYPVSGRAVVRSGKDGMALYTYLGGSRFLNLGIGVAGPGDITGDGYDDFVLGTIGADVHGDLPGSLRFYSGKDGKLFQEIFGAEDGDKFGYKVAVIGDVTGDGLADLAVSAMGETENGEDTGGVHMVARIPPTGTVVIDGGDEATVVTSVTLSLTAEGTGADVVDVRHRNAGDSWGAWLTMNASLPFTLTDLDGERSVEVQFRDEDGTVSAITSDTIVLDRTAPVGTVVIDAGADYTASPAVELSITPTDAHSGPADMRFRKAGGTWSDWQPVSGTYPWTLDSGDGVKTVDLQVRDLAGNLSAVASDTILLDQTAPVGTLIVNSGDLFTAEIGVTLEMTASDAGSGVAAMSFRDTDGNWLPFETYADRRDWTLLPMDATFTVEVRFRDGAGNVSDVVAADIILDRLPPQEPVLTVNDGTRYVRPEETLRFSVAAEDNPGGSGVAEFRFTVDAGTTWSDWMAFESGVPLTVPRPGPEGLLEALVEARDRVGNVSVAGAGKLYIIESDLLALAGPGQLTGDLGEGLDVDALTVDLVAGDLLSVKIKTKSAWKKTKLGAALDLIGPDGTVHVAGLYPTGSGKPGIKKFPVATTGRHLLVVRIAPGSASDRGSFKLKVSVKQAKENKKVVGAVTGTGFEFPAAAGTIFNATLKGSGLVPAGITLTGPTGPVTIDPRAAGKKVTVPSVVLGAGTGNYQLVVPAGTAVEVVVKLKLPKKVKAVLTE